jgi:hypothetical protein
MTYIADSVNKIIKITEENDKLKKQIVKLNKELEKFKTLKN